MRGAAGEQLLVVLLCSAIALRPEEIVAGQAQRRIDVARDEPDIEIVGETGAEPGRERLVVVGVIAAPAGRAAPGRTA